MAPPSGVEIDNCRFLYQMYNKSEEAQILQIAHMSTSDVGKYQELICDCVDYLWFVFFQRP